ncbi:TIR domain-containing protein [Kitasatospora sp. NPDC048365]|uniref:TIR domain-containing protein n=1 Tax=Kitasatospora sp. NPDC048365 TaxID=3364050 RepID=UPI003713B09E
MATSPDPKKVFVVHGRDHDAREELHKFLKKLGLEPIKWSDARALAVKDVGLAPTIMQIIRAGMEACQTIIVLMTPDERISLKSEFREKPAEDADEEQSRPNVIFEAGIAFGKYPDRSLIVSTSPSRVLSDLAGVHVVNLSSRAGLVEVKESLAARAIPITARTGWERAGKFGSSAEERYALWQEHRQRYKYLLSPPQLIDLRRRARNSQIPPHLLGYALTSAVQHGREGDVPYWISESRDDREAVLAMLDVIQHSRHLRPRFRAARALECMNPQIVPVVLSEYLSRVPHGGSEKMSIAFKVQEQKVISEVASYPVSDEVDVLTEAKRQALLEELSDYPPYRSRGFPSAA